MRKTAKERRIIKENKNAKEIKKSTSTNMFINSDNEVVNFLKILIILLILLVLFTVVTNIIVNKNKNKEKEPTTIQYTKIVVGNILNRKEASYYVLVENKEDSNLSTYESYITTYKNKVEHLSVYVVDLEAGFNETFKSETSNLNVTNISDIRFKDTALLKIEDGKITYATDNSDEILAKLKELSA